MVDTSHQNRTDRRADETFVVRLPEGTEFGPLSSAELRSLISQGAVPAIAFVRRATSTNWRLVSEVKIGKLSPSHSIEQPVMATLAPPAPQIFGPEPTPPAPQAAPPVAAGSPITVPQPRIVPVSKPLDQAMLPPSESGLSSALLVGVCIAFLAVFVVGMQWIKENTGLSAVTMRGIGKIVFMGVIPLIGGGIWAILKACKVVK